MGTVGDLWAAGQKPWRDGLYRIDDTGANLLVDGPGAYHPDAGQPIPFQLGGSFDVAAAIHEDGADDVDIFFDTPLPNGDGRMTGGGGSMGNIGWFARLDNNGALRWIATMFYSNPFTSVHYEATTAVFTNDWRNQLRLDLAAAAR
ncbi:hypothetical protein ACFXK0_07960 [Nocardia sp. NPDC059177]|uniref:hypothetical protein n=1 Tax=Nocardia sp. NPDC059177 TaxID=3346759 RepID=UPI0036751246